MLAMSLEERRRKLEEERLILEEEELRIKRLNLTRSAHALAAQVASLQETPHRGPCRNGDSAAREPPEIGCCTAVRGGAEAKAAPAAPTGGKSSAGARHCNSG